MKLFLKTVTGNQQETEAEETTTIADLKKKLENDYDLPTLRLCFKGAVLEDAKTVADLGLSEGDILVIAGKKKKILKPAAAAAAAAPPAPEVKAEAKDAEAHNSPAEADEKKAANEPREEARLEVASTPAETAATAPSDNTTAPEAHSASAAVESAAPAPASAAPAAPPAAAAAAAAPAHADPTHGVDSSLIDNLVAMGFDDRRQVALALRAAYMNPDRAVEYLCTGIPASVLSEFAQPATPAAAAHAPSDHPAAPATAAVQPVAAGTDLRSLLWNNVPHFDQIKAVYQENNSTLPVIMSQIAERYPQLYQLIEEEPEEFLTIMGERGRPATGGAAAGAAAGGVPADLPQSVAAELTPADATAIDQLVELGGGMWDRDAATLVYLAVERNQEVAASVLFEHGGIPPELLQQIAMQLQGQQEDDEEDADDTDNE